MNVTITKRIFSLIGKSKSKKSFFSVLQQLFRSEKLFVQIIVLRHWKSNLKRFFLELQKKTGLIYCQIIASDSDSISWPFSLFSEKETCIWLSLPKCHVRFGDFTINGYFSFKVQLIVLILKDSLLNFS